ncbi:MAG TPA: hypothetical protein VMZ51_09025 [Acidimicrobiales bacterium]|nr:hypothetical protein [Acidimicrobiales bacterium]
MVVSSCRWGRFIAGVAICGAVGWATTGAFAQVPTIPDPTTVSTTAPPPPKEEAPAVPGPGVAPAPPSTIDPGGVPETPGAAAPTTTTIPGSRSNSASGTAFAPARRLDDAVAARLSLDLSEIGALRRQARGKGPRAPERDFGFDENLPFGAASGDAALPSDLTELGSEAEQWARTRSAGAAAAGLLALVLAGLTRWTLRKTQASISGDATAPAPAP